MNNLIKVIGTTFAGIVVVGIGLFLFSVVAGFNMDEATYVEDDPTPNKIEVVKVSIGEGIVGSLRWEDTLGDTGTVFFEPEVADKVEYHEEYE